MGQLAESENIEILRKPTLPIRDFFNISEIETQKLSEAIITHGHKIIIAIHPFFEEYTRSRPFRFGGNDTYEKSRLKYLNQAAEAGWPILILEEKNVMRNQRELLERYQSIINLDTVYIVPTLYKLPVPVIPELAIVNRVIDTRYIDARNLIDYSQGDWENFNEMEKLAGLPTTPQPKNIHQFWIEKQNIEWAFRRAFRKLNGRAWDLLSQLLQDLSVESIKMGGSRFESLDIRTGENNGCLAYAAEELHQRGFRIQLSKYFSSPNQPRSEIRHYLTQQK